VLRIDNQFKIKTIFFYNNKSSTKIIFKKIVVKEINKLLKNKVTTNKIRFIPKTTAGIF
jgi:hypothetical protein